MRGPSARSECAGRSFRRRRPSLGSYGPKRYNASWCLDAGTSRCERRQCMTRSFTILDARCGRRASRLRQWRPHHRRRSPAGRPMANAVAMSGSSASALDPGQQGLSLQGQQLDLHRLAVGRHRARKEDARGSRHDRPRRRRVAHGRREGRVDHATRDRAARPKPFDSCEAALERSGAVFIWPSTPLLRSLAAAR